MLPWLLQTFTKNNSTTQAPGLRQKGWPEWKPNIGDMFPQHKIFHRRYISGMKSTTSKRHLTHTHPPCCETSRYPFFSFLRRTVKSLFCHGVDLETWGWKRFKASRVGGTNSAIGQHHLKVVHPLPRFFVAFWRFLHQTSTHGDVFFYQAMHLAFFQWLATCWFEQIPCPSRFATQTSYQVLVLQ